MYRFKNIRRNLKPMIFKHVYSFLLIGTLVTGCHSNSTSLNSASNTQPIDKKVFTAIQWKDSVIHLGNITMGDTVSFHFRFQNIGKEPLLIKEVITSCSCTHVDEVSQAIPPGGEGKIHAVFDTRKSIVGFVKKGILVTTNTQPAQKQLLYTAEVTGHKKIG